MVIAYKQGRSHRGILGIRGSLWEPPGGPTGERPHFLYCTGALWALLGQIRGPRQGRVQKVSKGYLLQIGGPNLIQNLTNPRI